MIQLTVLSLSTDERIELTAVIRGYPSLKRPTSTYDNLVDMADDKRGYKIEPRRWSLVAVETLNRSE